jgi:hypothetical protein
MNVFIFSELVLFFVGDFKPPQAVTDYDAAKQVALAMPLARHVAARDLVQCLLPLVFNILQRCDDNVMMPWRHQCLLAHGSLRRYESMNANECE